METTTETIVIGDRPLTLVRPERPEALLDEERFADDEFLPYWAESWPSGLALARHVADLELAGLRVLELGCGLGLPSLVAAARGADVLATDWAPEAVELLRENAERNGIALRAERRDWRDTVAFVEHGPFDLVLAADVLYEERNCAPLVHLLADAAEPAATVLVADPGRRHAAGFLELAERGGWVFERIPSTGLPLGAVHRLRR